MKKEYIDRNDLLLERNRAAWCLYEASPNFLTIDMIRNEIEPLLTKISEAPGVSPDDILQHGFWDNCKNDNSNYHFCTICKRQANKYLDPEDPRGYGEYLDAYCPHCGAKLDFVSAGRN